ncbi:hypothetical protein GCK72_002988 [Caenorhabditis remanei]|uniref:Uncharacterized protein n=1 Tax=Caenorhabditis remanei TaxID=31234 RepID=A0A6A5HY99_CAERE|nr:hypothetical protein GCK72_002988 [Caenorhabditis remanei]KAF1771162.1 hypothetical protein GCK72_002988 [Caenorhabditis remanei]
MPPSSSAAALTPTFYNNQDTTMIETHVLLTIACVKYKDALTDKKKEPRLWYTTMQKAMIDMLCVEVRKEIQEEERLKND